jgi:hypothetical protein
MSKKIVEKLYNERLLNLYSNKFRDKLEKRSGQALILNNTKAFNEVFRKYGIVLSKADLKTIRAAGIAKAKELHKGFGARNPELMRTFINKLIRIRAARRTSIGKTVFILSNWDSINIVKNVMIDTAESLNPEVSLLRNQIATDIHRGHGVQGNAVSEVSIAEGFRYLSKVIGVNKLRALTHEALTSSLIDLSEPQIQSIKSLETQYNQIIDPKGSLKANYISIVTFQSSGGNIRDSIEERALKDVFFKQFAPLIIKSKIENLSGFSTIKEKVLSSVLKPLTKTKSENVNVKISNMYNPKKVKLKTKGKASTTNRKAKKSSSARKHRPASARIGKLEVKTQSSLLDLRSLIPEINRRLPDIVAERMNSPRLNYRTGRFAQSAKVVDITRTPKGFPSVAFTYMRSPYQVFEFPGSGSPLANAYRDPRGIISESIREAAIGLINQRFFTRRV